MNKTLSLLLSLPKRLTTSPNGILWAVLVILFLLYVNALSSINSLQDRVYSLQDEVESELYPSNGAFGTINRLDKIESSIKALGSDVCAHERKINPLSMNTCNY